MIRWLPEPEDHDFPAAARYLELLLHPPRAARIADLLRGRPTLSYKAKDLLRASGLPLLSEANKHVRKDLMKIKKGVALSPILLVRGSLPRGMPLQLADGYHRVCAAYHVDENTDIPCRIVDLDW